MPFSRHAQALLAPIVIRKKDGYFKVELGLNPAKSRCNCPVVHSRKTEMVPRHDTNRRGIADSYVMTHLRRSDLD